MPYAQPHHASTPARRPGDDTEQLLRKARELADEGKSAEAFGVYIALLQHLPNDLAVLHGLGRAAHRSGYRSAARSVYEQLVERWPCDVTGRINLGSLLLEDGYLAGAKQHLEAALALDTTLTDPHRGLARIAQDRGDSEAADRHWRQSFRGQATVAQPCRGPATPVPSLLLVSVKGGNIPTQHVLDDRIHDVTILYAEYHRPDLPLPPHSVIFNAIGDADLCPAALEGAENVVARSGAPVINHPARVRETGRAANAGRLRGLPGVRTPRMQTIRRGEDASLSDFTFPLLLRVPGFHTGQHFVRIENESALEQARATLPGDELLAIEFLDARGPDGLVRKYRVMCIGGAFYPLHLAISADWKVHYFSADMHVSEAHRAEEQRFLADMPAVLGPRAMAALAHVDNALGLDYMGIDFALDASGELLLFEANATMLINPPATDAQWDYRRPAATRALAAARDLIVAK
ncbi:MAG TPA: hypothetical protein VHY57_09550 [Rhizomicrobium sp.]|nr:hypothetical protein [Rhizomicrobium sp.]